MNDPSVLYTVVGWVALVAAVFFTSWTIYMMHTKTQWDPIERALVALVGVCGVLEGVVGFAMLLS